MENKDSGVGQEGVKSPADSELIETYKGIESRAKEAIREERVVGNSTLEKGYFSPQWSIALQAFLEGTPAGSTIQSVIREIRQVEPNMSFMSPDLRHITLGELAYYEGEKRGKRRVGGRKIADMRSRNVLARYHAVNNNLPDFPPIRLRLWKIIPTLDPEEPGRDGQTMAVVAAFVTDGDPTIWRVRAALGPAVGKAGLSVYYRTPKVIFATVGRLKQAPVKDGNQVPLLDMLDVINRDLSPSAVDIDRIRMLSTVNYRTPPWVYIDPPIALRKGDRDPSLPLRYKRAPRGGI